MTSLNAAKAGLLDRGLLRPGQYADVVVFDPATVIDHSTYVEPFQYSTGIIHVLVNGKLALENGQPHKTSARDEPCVTAGRRRPARSLDRSRANKKPAREQIPNNHLSPGCSKSDRLAGWSRMTPGVYHHAWSRWLEKGRAGGRARQPARPLAWSRSKHLETTIASGVAAYKVVCGELELQPLFVDFVSLLNTDMDNRKSSARMVSPRQRIEFQAYPIEIRDDHKCEMRSGITSGKKTGEFTWAALAVS